MAHRPGKIGADPGKEANAKASQGKNDRQEELLDRSADDEILADQG